MFFTRISLTVAIVAVLVAVTAGFLFLKIKKKPQQINAASRQTERGLQLETPEPEWETSFFKALDERTKKINLSRLSTTELSDRDLEVRFWYDGRPYVINGFIIRRRAAQWSALGIRQTNEGEPSQVTQEPLPKPKSGWEAAWQRLIDAGILTLPDGSSIKRCNSEVLDGGGYVFETKVERVYRTYMYRNPQFANCDEAKQVLLIEKIIADEFAIKDAELRTANYLRHGVNGDEIQLQHDA
jgi:hypothetical protein